MARKRRDEIFDDDWGVVDRILNAFVGESGKKELPQISEEKKEDHQKRYSSRAGPAEVRQAEERH